MTEETKITRAKVQMLLRQPFFGTLAARLSTEFCDEIETADVDGKKIRFNRKFVASLTPDQLIGLFAHEVMHVANGHCWRRGQRTPRRWNIACDRAINPIILSAGMQLPPHGTMPTAAQQGKSAEWIYNDLPADANEPQSSFGNVKDAPTGEDASTQEAEWKIAVAQAAAAARAAGKLPANLDRLVTQLVTPQVPWDVVLGDFIKRNARNDYSWARANPRHLQRGIVLPSLISDELPEVVVVVDTSASITPAILSQFASEVSSILGQFNTTIHLLSCDTRITSYEMYTSADLPICPKMLGGGGTSFKPPFDWVAAQGLEPACLIYLTDLEGDFPEEAPVYPTLWITIGAGGKAPFGDVVPMELSN